MTTVLTVGIGGALIAVLLIALLSSRELITASSKKSSKILASLDSVIVPMLIVFVFAVAFNVLQATGSI
jgi:hypothetical protein